MKIVLSFDSFKGSMSALQACTACARGLRRVLPDAEIDIVPVGDGGEGTADALVAATHGRRVSCRTVDPLGRDIVAHYGISNRGNTAIIDIAAASGLTLLSGDERDTERTSSYGSGLMLRHALDAGCRQLCIGLGGTATVDGGMGLLAACGVRFTDRHGNTLPPCGASLALVEGIDTDGIDPRLTAADITLLCDVINPLTGPQGAAAVFGPQKGADAAAVQRLEAGLTHYADLLAAKTLCNIAAMPRGGAAGGIAAALVALTGAKACSGIDAVLDTVDFDRRLVGADLVITGEGRIDSQTLCGKAPGGVMQRARAAGVPVIALCGCKDSAAEAALINAGFAAIYSISDHSPDPMNPHTAQTNMQTTAQNIGKQFLR